MPTVQIRSAATKQWLGPALISGSVFLLSVSILIFYAGVPIIIERKILERVQLVHGSDIWKLWTNITIPVFMTFYYFNVTNADDVLNGSKFVLEEVGPYTWQESRRVKDIQAVDEDEDTVTYQETIYYTFRPDLSAGSEDDVLDVVNIPFISLATLLYKHLHTSLADLFITNVISGDEEIVRRGVTVRDITFDGIKLDPIYASFAALSGLELPQEFGDGTRFAYFNGKNATPSKEFIVNRGVKRPADLGHVVSYDKNPRLKWWGNDNLNDDRNQYCNFINGSDGSLYPPFLTKDSIIRIFESMICRSIFMTFKKERVFNGIPAYHFTVPPDMLERPDLNEDNRCFCTNPGEGLAGHCLRGVIRLFTCKGGAPIAVSHPHLLGASEEIQDDVIVKRLNNDRIETELDVEPNTGVLLRMAKRIQLNMEYQTLSGVESFENVPHTAIPIFWAEELATMDEAHLSMLRNELLTPLKIIQICKWIAFPACIAALIFGIVITTRKKDEKAEMLSMTTYEFESK